MAGYHHLQSIDGKPLPIGTPEGYWLFESRMQVFPDGVTSTIDVGCTQSGDACPRQMNAATGSLRRVSDGRIELRERNTVLGFGHVDASGRFVVKYDSRPVPGVPVSTSTYVYQRGTVPGVD